MKRLLRSVIDFGDSITADNLNQNWRKLQESHIEWNNPADEKVFNYVKSYFQQRLDLPSATTVNDHFSRVGGQGDVEVTERLKDIAAAPAYWKTNYAHLLQTLFEEQNKNKTIALLKETGEIVTRGLDVIDGKDKVRRHGVRDALIHFTSRSHKLIIPEHNAKISGDIRQDGQAVWDEYITAKVNKDKAWGKFTGLNNIDVACHGIKKGELWVHAAFPGELKTTMALNWCYNLVTRYKAHVLYFSFEMPYEQVRRQIYCIHTAHAKWGVQGYAPLDYRKVRDGELSPPEEEFFQKVIDDFCNNPDYCTFEVKTPDREYTIDDIRLEAEILHKELEVGLIVLDHGQLIEARKAKRSKDYGIELNSVVRDAKKMCLYFNNGEKIPVLLLFQINRQGKEDAVKNGGRYKSSAIAYANEVEKSADYLTTTFLDDDHRAKGTTLFTNIKNRENAPFEPFLAKVNFSCRRIYNMDVTQGLEGRGMTLDEHQSRLDAMINQV